MAKNEVYRVGQYVPLPVPDAATGDTTGGTGRPLRIGGLNVVQVTPKTIDEDSYVGGNYPGYASCDLGGAHKFPVTVSGGALKAGQPIYITTANALVTTATDNNLFGHSLEEGHPNGAQQVVVRIAN
jgi:hypothetical protein